MRLFAAIVPPREARVALAQTVDAVAADTDQLVKTPVEGMAVFVCRFGNVTMADERALEHALRTDVPHLAGGEARITGGTALEWRGDESVWAKLEGDLDQMAELARVVPLSVQRLGFFVDRRAFKPWISVGEINENTTAPYLESVVATLDGFEGEPWRFEALRLCRWLPAEDLAYGGFDVIAEFNLEG